MWQFYSMVCITSHTKAQFFGNVSYEHASPHKNRLRLACCQSSDIKGGNHVKEVINSVI